MTTLKICIGKNIGSGRLFFPLLDSKIIPRDLDSIHMKKRKVAGDISIGIGFKSPQSIVFSQIQEGFTGGPNS